MGTIDDYLAGLDGADAAIIAAIVAVLPLLDGVDHAKGTIRFTEPLPDDTVRAFVAARRAQIDGWTAVSTATPGSLRSPA